MIRNLSEAEISNTRKSINYCGYSIINSLLNDDLTADVLSAVESDFHATERARPKLKNVSTNQLSDKYVYHLQFKRKFYIDLLTSGNLLDVVIPFLNDEFYRQLPADKPNFLLAYYNARSSVAALPLYQDNYITYSGPHPISMQVAISLTGQDEENGATVIVPGTHQSARLPDRSFSNVEILELKAGDAVIWDSRLWHGAYENRSGRDRWSLIATLRPWWAKQNFDPVRGMSAELFDSLSDFQKAFLGFLSLPAVDQDEKVALKEGYSDLLGSIQEYRKRRVNNA